MKWNVLISAPYMQKELDEYSGYFKKHDINIDVPEVDERLGEERLIDIIDKYHGVVAGDDEFTKKVFKKADKLKVISKWGTGIDSIDLEAAKKHNIRVYNTPDAFSHPVADTVMGFLLTFFRNIIETDKQMKDGRWNKIKGKSLSELNLGIIGIGNVGSHVARRANSFDMTIYGNDIREIKSIIVEEYNINMVSKEEIYKKSDVISLNCDLNETSHHLLTQSEFSKMEKKPIIINTARGPLVKKEDLIEALQKNKIKGAGLDVFEQEPLPKDSPLRNMKNVVLSPHNANSSPKYWKKVHENTLHKLLKGLKGDNDE